MVGFSSGRLAHFLFRVGKADTLLVFDVFE